LELPTDFAIVLFIFYFLLEFLNFKWPPLAGIDGEAIDLQIYLLKRMEGEICKLKNNLLFSKRLKFTNMTDIFFFITEFANSKN